MNNNHIITTMTAKLNFYFIFIIIIIVSPSVLGETIIIQDTIVTGQITQSGLIDVIAIGQIPTFTVS